MWCTTECWDCEDKKCENYISKQRLYFERKELCKQMIESKTIIDNKNKWLQLIIDIGFDYDGYNDVENLKQLIDELVSYSRNARDNYDYEKYILGGKE